MPREYFQSPHFKRSFWSDEKTAKLIELWGQGMTCAAIARAIGMSRNAVWGKAWRVGLRPRDEVRPLRDKTGRMISRSKGTHGVFSLAANAELPPAIPRERTPREVVANAQESQIRIKKVEQPMVPVRLSTDKCRWVYELPHAGNAAVFCDKPTIFNKSYSPDHHGLCVRRERDSGRAHLLPLE